MDQHLHKYSTNQGQIIPPSSVTTVEKDAHEHLNRKAAIEKERKGTVQAGWIAL